MGLQLGIKEKIKIISKTSSHIFNERTQMAQELLYLKLGGFDTHAAQGGVDGTHTKCLVEMDEIFNNLKDNLQEDQL